MTDAVRTVERFGAIVIVSYSRLTWTKGAAWAHLEANRPDGVPPELASNPWRKKHTLARWVWRYDPTDP